MQLQREYFGDTREPFAINLAGKIIYIPTSGADVTRIYDNIKTISFDLMLSEMFKSFGFSGALIDKLLQQSEGPSNVVRLLPGWQVQQTQGERLDDLDHRISDYLKEMLVLGRIPVSSTSKHCDFTETVVSLKHWSLHTIVGTVQNAYFGHSLGKIQPDLAETLIKFDSLAWQAFLHVPQFFSWKMKAKKSLILQAITCYFETPTEKRFEEAWLIRTLEEHCRSTGFSTHELATLVAFFFWRYISIDSS